VRHIGIVYADLAVFALEDDRPREALSLAEQASNRRPQQRTRRRSPTRTERRPRPRSRSATSRAPRGPSRRSFASAGGSPTSNSSPKPCSASPPSRRNAATSGAAGCSRVPHVRQPTAASTWCT
jgi:hypothetical protein